ncbi:hypothetical protein RGQ29_032882 [Quercus rubra]|uniref:phosphopyruvate hydratase n=1 Tax=Quercus rubra TaxID=3512 RepID=A0AAN7DUD3_QUERU|nr:hypothetical protein RGQ29_032882 [Quercus rubra]
MALASQASTNLLQNSFLPSKPRNNHAVKYVKARQIVDSRGNPTVEVDLVTDQLYRSAVPSGASTGIYEALELRDGDKSVYGGKVFLSELCQILSYIWLDQADVDAIMLEIDGTPNKSKLGANAILGVSLSVCRAGAGAKGVPLYKHIQEISGTKELAAMLEIVWPMQEFMILPVGATSFAEAFRMGSEVFYHTLKGIIKAKYGQDACNVGDEGGFAPNVQDNREGLVLLIDAIEKAGYTGKAVDIFAQCMDKQCRLKIGMDVAASEFLTKDGKYDLDFKKQPNNGAHVHSAQSLCDLYKEFVKEFPILTFNFVGDDLLVTNPTRIAEAIQKRLAMLPGWGVMVSHRSGETEDNFIADLSVGLASGQIKTGAPCRSERLAKYNQLLRIEEELGNVRYAGEAFRSP